jgi:hypothetical protein
MARELGELETSRRVLTQAHPTSKIAVTAGGEVELEAECRWSAHDLWLAVTLRNAVSKKPLAGVACTLLSSSSAPVAKQSDKRGRLKFPLSPGDSRLQVEHKGLFDLSLHVPAE